MHINSFSTKGFLVAASMVCSSYFVTTARAQEVPEATPEAAPEEAPEAPAEDRPWTQGVSAEAQEQALKIFNEGNGYFETSQYALATEKYREALKSWHHPAIHFNMTVCLINLDKPMQAHEHLQQALKYGAAPLSKDVHARALTYEKLLAKQLTPVTIKSTQEGVKISLDGKTLFVSPGESSFVAVPGPHQLVASKDGYLPYTAELTFVGGEASSEEVKLIPLAEAQSYRLERRWAIWKPWAVFGAGAATAVLGLGGRLVAKSDFDRYDNDVAILCPPQGCAKDEIPKSTKDVLSRAKLEDKVSNALLVTGAAATTAGVVLLYLNRERNVKESLPTVNPIVTPEGVGVSLAFPLD